MGAGTLSDSYTPEQHRLLKRAKAARQVLERDDVDPVLLLAAVVWPTKEGDARELAIAGELEARRVAEERAAEFRRLGGGWLAARQTKSGSQAT